VIPGETPTSNGRPTTPGFYASHWRSLDYFNLYRLTLAVALAFTGLLFGDSELFRAGAGDRYTSYAFSYLIIAALFVLGIRARWPKFQIQLSAHIIADIMFVVLLMSTSPRLAGGLGLLLVISIASGGLVGSGRLTLLYAALASIAVLLQDGLPIGALEGGEVRRLADSPLEDPEVKTMLARRSLRPSLMRPSTARIPA